MRHERHCQASICCKLKRLDCGVHHSGVLLLPLTEVGEVGQGVNHEKNGTDLLCHVNGSENDFTEAEAPTIATRHQVKGIVTIDSQLMEYRINAGIRLLREIDHRPLPRRSS